MILRTCASREPGSQSLSSRPLINKRPVRLALTRADWRWLVDDSVLICGLADTPLGADSLLDELISWQKLSNEALGDLLARLNGFHSIILTSAQRVVFAVDKVRSIPLFYTLAEQILHISDDANALLGLHNPRSSTDTATIDPVTAAEFASALYLNGARTLHSQILQVRAGEWVESASPHTPETLASLPYVVQEAAGRLKLRVQETLYTTSIQPVPSQPFSQVYEQDSANEPTLARAVGPSQIRPVDALRGLALAYLNGICEKTLAVSELDSVRRLASPIMAQRTQPFESPAGWSSYTRGPAARRMSQNRRPSGTILKFAATGEKDHTKVK